MVGVNRAVQKPKKTSDDVQVDEEDQEEEKVEDEIAARNEAEEDQFEAAMGIRNVDTWSAGGVKKDIVIRILVQCFASMVESTPREGSIPDFKGRFKPEDMEYHKLLDASRQVVKAKKYVLLYSHFLSLTVVTNFLALR